METQEYARVPANVRDTTLLDRIGGRSVPLRQVVALNATVPSEKRNEEDDDDEEEEGKEPVPSGRYNAKRLTARLEATR